MLNFTTARMDPLKYIFEKPSFAKQKKKGAGGDSLKAKKLRMTLSRRRRAKANTGGRPRLSYFNTLCAHQYWTQRKYWFEVEWISRYLIPISGIGFGPNSHCFQHLLKPAPARLSSRAQSKILNSFSGPILESLPPIENSMIIRKGQNKGEFRA